MPDVFDGFSFDHRTLELRLDGEPVKLQQQPARVLSLLIQRAGELVTREELKEAIWGGDTFVDFSRGLNFCVSQIRTALNDTAESPRYLETLRGRGYRFIGKLNQPATLPIVLEPPPSHRWWWIGAIAGCLLVGLATWTAIVWARPPAHLVGIAPFETASSVENAWSSSLHAQLLSRVALATQSQVVDLATVTKSRVTWRLEGRVDKSNEQYRVTVTLRKTADGSVRWTDVFDGPPGDWIDAQNEMAMIVAQAVRYYVDPDPGKGIPRRTRRREPPAVAN